MSGVNKVIIVGNLGQDPEVRYMPSGDAVANMSLATSESWKDKQTGEQKEVTEWHKVAIFGKLAEIAGQYLKKGSKVYIEGKLKTRKWTDQQGVEKYTTEIILDGFNSKMEMLDGKPQGQSGGQQQGGFAPQQQAAQQQQQQGGGFQQQAPQQQAPQQSGGFQQQQQQQPSQQQIEKQQRTAAKQHKVQQDGGYQQAAPQQQQQDSGFQQQQQPHVNPQEPSIDFDNDIPF